MMRQDTWGDSNTLNAFSLYWSARIIVVIAANGLIRETRYHCDETLPLEEADFVLLYNGAKRGHYSICRE